MAKPVYKLWTAKFNEAWHLLSKQEQDELMAKVSGAMEQAGGKSLVVCNSAWSSEEWPVFGVEQFPDIEAVQKHTEILAGLNWTRYLTSKTLIGTEWESQT